MATSNKDYRLQAEVLRRWPSRCARASSRDGGDARKAIWWPANQAIASDRSTLTYGQSMHRACIDLATPRRCSKELAEAVAELPGRPRWGPGLTLFGTRGCDCQLILGTATKRFWLEQLIAGDCFKFSAILFAVIGRWPISFNSVDSSEPLQIFYLEQSAAGTHNPVGCLPAFRPSSSTTCRLARPPQAAGLGRRGDREHGAQCLDGAGPR